MTKIDKNKIFMVISNDLTNSSIHKSGFKMLVEKKMSRDATE